MRQSQLFTKTLKSVPADERSANAQLLARGGFVYKNSAGVYSYLPLGWRVIESINSIIREEMNAIGGVEVFLPALVERKYLEATNRFHLPVGFDVRGKGDKEAVFSLGWTHEEVICAIAKRYISSYKDLPIALYQVQTKFRNEPRVKSGLLRGREFLMKDLYSFHTDEQDLFRYYDKVKNAYFKVFKRCGLKTYYTLAGGGNFTISNTHEFQVLAGVGEDAVFYCAKCEYAENAEVSRLKEGVRCPKCRGNIGRGDAIEVGNIFPLGTKYSEAFDLSFQDKNGKKKLVVMGSYGIGVSRLMAAVVEAHHDDNGIVWPQSVAPFLAHLIPIFSGKSEKSDRKIKTVCDKLYEDLSVRGACPPMPRHGRRGSTAGGQKQGIEVLYDDREDKSVGEKFADADLIGIPYRIVVSERTVARGSVEVKKRSGRTARLIRANLIHSYIRTNS